ncbi:MAG: hypothetical protein KVP17_000509 [Porospora cf. gigantea B]|uniref:uncharacterized protein n=1 Tax=Porospora cf. gigantea B TaxID=2853592 RepID=UPI0035717CF0|nr:MAG: hypothetical protein KVP17_000509 [Porospora cf. gigantea B]
MLFFSLLASVCASLSVGDLTGSWVLLKAMDGMKEVELPQIPTLEFREASSNEVEVRSRVVNSLRATLKVHGEARSKLQFRGGEVMSTRKSGAADLMAEEYFLIGFLENLESIVGRGERLVMLARDQRLYIEKEEKLNRMSAH